MAFRAIAQCDCCSIEHVYPIRQSGESLDQDGPVWFEIRVQGQTAPIVDRALACSSTCAFTLYEGAVAEVKKNIEDTSQPHTVLTSVTIYRVTLPKALA